MGRRKKKQFINKKQANTYTLVADGDGIAVPDSEFGSKAPVEGKLDRVVPVMGPRPDWDPDVVEALDNAEMSDGGDQLELEDDFIMLANGGESGGPVAVSNKHRDGLEDGKWWMDRMVGFSSEALASRGRDDKDGDDECSSTEGNTDSEDDESESRTARFTEYSMTSSVLPRSEALTLLDDRFEQFMIQYDDDQLGAGDDEGADTVGGASGDRHHRAEYDDMLLQTALNDFEKNFAITHKLNEGQLGDSCGMEKKKVSDGDRREMKEVEESCGGEAEEGGGSTEEEDEDVPSDGEGGWEPLDRVEVSGKSQWDCESILSTYSTLYNHPTKIVEPRSSTSVSKVKLSRKTGIPLGVIPGPTPKESIPKKMPISRPKNETKDEKNLRKNLQKSERKQRRAEKKATKLAFKSEEVHQTNCMMGVAHARAGCAL